MPHDSNPLLCQRDYHLHWTSEVLRYSDTDRQGHVNNAIFATLFESGRVGILYDSERSLAPAGASFVLARLVLEFRAELHWPNQLEVGTTVTRLGRSSITFGQGLFIASSPVGGSCVAVSENVAVLIDDATRKARPLTEVMRADLSRWMHAPG